MSTPGPGLPGSAVLPGSTGLPGSTATYVFAVCRGLDPAVLTLLPGLEREAPVRTLPFGTLTAVVQHVTAAHFADDGWQERLSDRGELERCARAHHEVVSAAAARGPTVPLALATLYHDDERARHALRKDADRFHTALRRVEGRVEWGVKVYEPAPPRQPPVPATAPGMPATTRAAVATPGGGSPPSPGAGRAYLDRKRGAQRLREQHHDEALRTADTVDRALRALAVASRRLRTHTEALPETRGTQILNAAYLVAADRSGALADAVRSLRARTGAHIEMSGPWAPYSFVGEV